MAVVKIVPMPGGLGPAGPAGPVGPQGPSGVDGAVATFSNISAWTPIFAGEGLVQSSNLATGTYVEMGKLVHVTITIPFSNISSFGSGQYSVSLPFPSARHGDVFAGSLHDTDSLKFYSLKGHHEANSEEMSLWILGASSFDEPFSQTIPTLLDNTDLIHLSFIYEIA